MTVLGHPWTQATASELERETGQRALTIDELGALALVVGATVPELVDFGENRKDRLDYGHPEVAMKPRAAVSWLRGYSRVSITSVDDDGTIHWKIAPATRPGDGEEAR